jgi:hypothetical protein
MTMRKQSLLAVVLVAALRLITAAPARAADNKERRTRK